MVKDNLKILDLSFETEPEEQLLDEVPKRAIADHILEAGLNLEKDLKVAQIKELFQMERGDLVLSDEAVDHSKFYNIPVAEMEATNKQALKDLKAYGYGKLNTKKQWSGFDTLVNLGLGGYAPALYSVGNVYSYGIYVKQDHKQAFNWYKKSADQGYVGAQAALGGVYFNGRGVTKDFKQAAKWGWY